jgi:carbonic anhydrase
VSQLLLGTQEILVMHHRDCSMCHVRDDELAAAVERHTDGWSMTHSRVDLS